MSLYDFLSILTKLELKSFNIDHVIKKVVCSIFDVNLFDIPHLY